MASDFSPERHVTVHGNEQTAELTRWSVPASELRRYSGLITLDEGMVVTADATLLPASFKWSDHPSVARNCVTSRRGLPVSAIPHQTSRDGRQAATTSSSPRTPGTTGTS